MQPTEEELEADLRAKHIDTMCNRILMDFSRLLVNMEDVLAFHLRPPPGPPQPRRSTRVAAAAAAQGKVSHPPGTEEYQAQLPAILDNIDKLKAKLYERRTLILKLTTDIAEDERVDQKAGGCWLDIKGELQSLVETTETFRRTIVQFALLVGENKARECVTTASATKGAFRALVETFRKKVTEHILENHAKDCECVEVCGLFLKGTDVNLNVLLDSMDLDVGDTAKTLHQD
ncbi:hypothetical protein B0H66DRAFT_297160 [Apodospora peruviana]|uniref:Uncharacterized protein n=1 Tax=Apodospora peruviana TaxID=516989 RepID=A0AAE0M2E0_9PEZI|nr:hypothetical protein B0H66DRAFT_297160 [Apodospora peruviana]